MGQTIYKYFLASALLCFIAIDSSAQCSFSATLTTKPVYCNNDGAMTVSISNPSDFGTITYGISTADGVEVVPTTNTSNIITGLAIGNYVLTISAPCQSNISGPQTIETRTFTIRAGVGNSVALKASLNPSISYTRPSLNTYGSGTIGVNISGGTSTSAYTVTLEQYPIRYTGPVNINFAGAGTHIVGNLVATAPGEYYRLKVSDGCNYVYINNISVEAVSEDVPTSLTGYGTNSNLMSFRRYTPAEYINDNIAYPSRNYTDLILDNGLTTSSFTAHVYLKSDTIRSNYYEVAYSYSADSPSEDQWTAFPEDMRDIVVRGTKYYSQIIANPTAGNLPYLHVRLKGYPETRKYYNSYSMMNSIQYNAIATTNGIKVTLHSPRLNNYSFLSVPYKFGATRGSSDDVETEVNIPEGSPASNYYVLPSITIPYSPTSQTWTVYNQGISPGDSNLYETSSLRIGVRSRDFYLNPTWTVDTHNAATTGGSPCETLYGGRTIRVKPSSYDSRVKYAKVVFTMTTMPTGVSLPAEITSATINPLTHAYSLVSNYPLPAGTYKWTVQIYDETDNVMSTQNNAISVTINENPPEVRFKDGADFTVYEEPVAGNVCNEYWIRLSINELKELVEKKYSGSTTWNNSDGVSFQFYAKDSDGNYSAIRTSDIEPVNLTFFNRPYTKAIGKGSAYAFYLYDLLYAATFTSGTDPIFKIKASGTIALVASLAFSSYYDLTNNTEIMSNGVIGYSVSNDELRSGNSGTCWIKKEFVVEENDLSRVQINTNTSGAFRCNPSVPGQMTINASTNLSASELITYNISGFDINGTEVFTNTYQSTNRSYTISNIPLGVIQLFVEIAGATCIDYPATYIMPVYDLTSSSLTSYTGGVICENGVSSGVIEPLELYATSIINTQYQWYYPDGTVVPTTYNGNTHHATIPPSDFQAGTYRCVLSNPTCTEPGYEHTLYVSEDGGTTLYWSIDAADTDFTNSNNWRTATGEISTVIPDKCTDIVIPGNVNANFPDLSNNYGNEALECRNITFRYGGQMYYSNLLTYEKAYVEYNTKYYSSAPTSDDNSLPDAHSDEGVAPEGGGVTGNVISGLNALDRNRWYMISAPVKGMYSGDFQMNGYPYTFNALYNKRINNAASYITKAIATDTEYISVIGDNDQNFSSTHNALLYWVPSFTTATGGAQDILQNKEGKIRAPESSTSFYNYDMKTLTTGSTKTIDREANRFIIEDDSNSPGTQYNLVIPSNSVGSNGLVMIGNPLMAPINLGVFYSKNNTIIENEIKILTHNGSEPLWEIISPITNTDYIAPLQGFVIKLKDPTISNTVTFDYNEIQTSVPEGYQIRVK